MTQKHERFSHLSPCQLAYIAGFLDGDGSIFTRIVSRPDYVLKFEIRVSVSFLQKTKRKHFLMKIEKELKTGTIRDRPDKMTELVLIGHNTVLPFLKQIREYLRIKQKQADLMIRLSELTPYTKNAPEKFLELCELSKQITALNDSEQESKFFSLSEDKSFIIQRDSPFPISLEKAGEAPLPFGFKGRANGKATFVGFAGKV